MAGEVAREKKKPKLTGKPSNICTHTQIQLLPQCYNRAWATEENSSRKAKNGMAKKINKRT